MQEFDDVDLEASPFGWKRPGGKVKQRAGAYDLRNEHHKIRNILENYFFLTERGGLLHGQAIQRMALSGPEWAAVEAYAGLRGIVIPFVVARREADILLKKEQRRKANPRVGRKPYRFGKNDSRAGNKS